MLLVLALSLAAAPPQEVPSKSVQKKLVREYFELDPLHEETPTRWAQIEAQLAAVPLTRASTVKAWQKTIDKEAKRARVELEDGGGDHWFWTEPRRGLYLVGGETKKPRGLLIGMHGGGVGSGDAHSIFPAIDAAGRDHGLLAICPEVLEKTERGWTDSGTEEWVLRLVDCALQTWDLDPDRVYFTGHSMGGYGSWVLGAHHADRVAGLAPSAGSLTPVYGPEGAIVDLMEGIIPNLRLVPMVVYQSIDDPRVPPDVNQAAARAVAAAKKKWGGYDRFEYWEVDGRGHAYPPGGMTALVGKLMDWKRDPIPNDLLWQPALPWKPQFHWLYWPDPQLGAVIHAKLDPEARRIEISTAPGVDLSGLEILLRGDLLAKAESITLSINGEVSQRDLPQADLATLLKTSRSPDRGLQFTMRLPVLE